MRGIVQLMLPASALILCWLIGGVSAYGLQDPITVTLAARTEIVLAAPKDLYSNTLLEDETVLLKVVEEVKAQDRVVIARDAEARARVKTAKPPASFGRGGELVLEFVEVTAVDGQKIDLEGEYRARGEGRRGTAAGLSILLGPLGGKYQEGRPARIKAGEKMTALTSTEAIIEVKP